jgi:hypothetical protein
MEASQMIDRREFTTRSLMALFSGVAVTISGCGGGSDGGPSGPSSSPSPQSGDKVGDITANHGHRAVITNAQLTAGGAVLLDIGTSASTHSHTVDLTAAEVVSIRGGTRVSKRSSNTEAHDHTVTFN